MHFARVTKTSRDERYRRAYCYARWLAVTVRVFEAQQLSDENIGPLTAQLPFLF